MLRSLKLKNLRFNVFKMNNSIKYFAEKKKVCVVDNPYTLNVYNLFINILIRPLQKYPM